jgi:hypothetical protein
MRMESFHTVPSGSEGVHAISNVSDTSGKLSPRLQHLRYVCKLSNCLQHPRRVWKAFTPTAQKHLDCIHAISSVSDMSETRSRCRQRRRRVWNAFTPSPASQMCLECLHAIPSISYTSGTLSRCPNVSDASGLYIYFV